jgi:integrase
MPKRATRKTQNWVDAVRPPRRGLKWYFLGTVAGLALRVSSSCAKDYYLWFKVPDPKRPGKTKSKPRKLGEHPTMTLKQAEDIAIAAKESRDPLAYLDGTEDTRPTVEALERLYEAGHLQGLKSGARSASRLERHVLPVWGPKVAETVSRKDATTLFDRITTDSGPVECLATYQLVQGMLRWGVAKGHIERNPLEGYAQPHKVGRRLRTLSDAELVKLWLFTYQIEGAFGVLLRVLILTGLRRSEAAGIHDREIEGDAIRIPGDRMKNGEPHYVPITSMLAREIEPLRGQGFLISANNGRTAFQGFGRAKTLLDRRLVLDAPWALHDLRRTVRSGLGALNVNRDIAERAVAHKVGSQLDQLYDRHTYEPQITQAMEKWSAHVRDLVIPPPPNLARLPEQTAG